MPLAPAKLILGTLGAISSVTFADDDPTELMAVTIKAVAAKVTVGVPLMTQVE